MWHLWRKYKITLCNCVVKWNQKLDLYSSSVFSFFLVAQTLNHLMPSLPTCCYLLQLIQCPPHIVLFFFAMCMYVALYFFCLWVPVARLSSNAINRWSHCMAHQVPAFSSHPQSLWNLFSSLHKLHIGNPISDQYT